MQVRIASLLLIVGGCAAPQPHRISTLEEQIIAAAEDVDSCFITDGCTSDCIRCLAQWVMDCYAMSPSDPTRFCRDVATGCLAKYCLEDDSGE